jgi:uncharacterized protein involved in exopolysaccharide biosynthesis
MSAMSLNNLVHLLSRRWPVVFAVSLLLFGGAATYILSLAPAYTSEAVVLLSPASEELAEQAKNGGGMTDPFFIRSETAIISGDGLSRTVIERLQLWQYPEFLPSHGLKEQIKGYVKKLVRPNSSGLSSTELSTQEILLDQVLRNYRKQLSVFNDGRSKTVEIEFSASNPRLAATIANEHAEAYLLQQSSRRLDAQQKTIEWLAHEVDRRAQEVRDAEIQVQQYQLQHGIVNTKDATIIDQRLSQLSTQLVDARRQLSTQNALLSEVRQIRAGRDPQSAVKLLADESLKELLARRVSAEANVLALSKRLAANHPH